MRFIPDISTQEIKTNHENFIKLISSFRILKVWDMELKNTMKSVTGF